MEKLQEVSNYLDNLKIKKTFFGGYDREDVFEKFQELTELFQKCMEDEQERQKEVIKEYELQMQTSQMLVQELNKKLSNLSAEQKTIEQEKEKMKEVYKDYCSNILKQYSESLRTLSTEFAQILDNITNLQQNIIETEFFDGLDAKLEEAEAAVLLEAKTSGAEEMDIEGKDSVEQKSK